MNDFEKLVSKCYRKNSDDTISNGSMEHAKVLVKYLFLRAKDKGEDVRIITGTLEKNFYEMFTESIQGILENNNVSIISENNCQDSTFKKAIEQSNKGSIKKVANGIISLPHFILVGDSAYRLEIDDNLKRATASFNRPSIGKFLLNIFDGV